ncbi:SAM-dependent methyltransferase [Geotalea daltonii FRC-32]|uniref:SAM-dependent methyltransferase n=1 Tax=Geotalea daltonii (strain DSM 22248 / JCM 15807 / FRC-32) TaxID=316067 RepID=B9M0I9_GEODF|nr:class I SAM-dependent methyltransferase [Geotalea daltonii]ACM19026.1 SAM-dependent methyltransferase [Geotalea daltonii FRC-32]
MEDKYISEHIEYKDEERIRLGMMSSHRWRMDPKVLLFSMARYKFIAKMLAGKKDLLEVGCGDGWGTNIVAREVGSIHCVDMDPVLIKECEEMRTNERITFALHDLRKGPVSPARDAVYLLDVLEHLEKEDEDAFLKNVAASITADGVCIVGIPSLESQEYASKPSRATHVNCKSGNDLKATLEKYFKNVFLFSMNDEVVHTGFSKMAHYLICLCVGVR